MIFALAKLVKTNETNSISPSSALQKFLHVSIMPYLLMLCVPTDE